MAVARPYTKTEIAIANPLIKLMSRLNTWAYRATGGRVGGKFRSGAPVMLLTTIGRKSGRRLTIPHLRALFLLAGLEPYEECGSFERTPLDNSAEQMVFLLKRRKRARS